MSRTRTTVAVALAAIALVAGSASLLLGSTGDDGRLRVVALGDSITRAGADPGTSDLGRGWFAYVIAHDHRLRGVANLAVSGQTAAQVSRRLPAALDRRPDLLMIMAGTNDIRRGVPQATTVRQLRSIVRGAIEAGVRPMIATIPPRGNSAAAATIRSLNDAIRSIAASEHAGLLDLYPEIATPEGTYRAGMSDDGLHPNARGSRVLGRAAVDALRSAGIS